MEIRPVQASDLSLLSEIDGTIESTKYIHVDRGGGGEEGFNLQWKLQERPLRERLAKPNPLDDEAAFWVKQIATGADEGLALMGEHEDVPVALVIASPDYAHKVLKIHEWTSTTAGRDWGPPCYI